MLLGLHLKGQPLRIILWVKINDGILGGCLAKLAAGHSWIFANMLRANTSSLHHLSDSAVYKTQLECQLICFPYPPVYKTILRYQRLHGCKHRT